MKHLFIVNPVAGKQSDPGSIIWLIKSEMKRLGKPYEIYVTTAPMDATEKVGREAAAGEELRVYACGGDGTLNECVNGAAGYENAAVTHYPCGTGNDFLKIFGSGAGKFRDIQALVDGERATFDLIDCNGRLSVNICSVGIDARIGTEVHKYSKLPLVTGPGGYVLSMIVNFAKGIKQPMTITSDAYSARGDYSLICACNGRYYGGGFNPVPDAQPDDGSLDFLIVPGVSRFEFLLLVGKYAKGRYRELPDKIIHIRAASLSLEAKECTPVNIDGERMVADSVCFRLSEKKINFIHPKGATWKQSRLMETEEKERNHKISRLSES